MAEVGYLLGAGASADCIPVVNQMANEVDILLAILNEKKYFGFDNESIDIIKLRLKKFKVLCENDVSIDTYAKNLYIAKRHKEYVNIKIEISYFFSLIQLLKQPDKRYRNFWATILNSSRPPSNIKIISWNYDFQFEQSFRTYANMDTVSEAAEFLSISYPGNIMDRFGSENFHISKLNGSAKFINNSSNCDSYFCDFASDNKIEEFKNLEKNYQDALTNKSDTISSGLKFAWDAWKQNEYLQSLIPMLEKIDTLIIIGYSFPTFNRRIDNFLFNNMKSLKNVTIQDPNPEFIQENLKFIDKFRNNNFKNKESINIEVTRNKNLFFIPNEIIA